MSSALIRSKCFVLFLLATFAAVNCPAQKPSATESNTRTTHGPAENPAEIFQRGQDSLVRNQLDQAERDFRRVLELDPQAGSAYANLGVINMRRKQWTKAIQSLEKAEQLMPQVAGIRLNIGLAYYRQNEFLKAIPLFESVVREQPDIVQPRYLLGLCYFFADRWGDSADTLQPLWNQESDKFPYLYVLSNAAHRAGKTDLDNRATERLIKIGNGSPEYHLFVGKYHLNLDQYDQAQSEFETAAAADPKLPFVHFNLGLVHKKQQQYSAARDEFMKDAAIEPDLALNYNELGDVYWLMQDDAKAESSYRQALRRDPRLVDSHLGLAKIYQRQKRYPAALAAADAAIKFDADRTDAHYVRGQILLHLGRKEEAKKEMEAAAGNGDQRKNTSIPSPELLEDSQ